MKAKTLLYICYICEGQFESGWTEEQAVAAYIKEHGEEPGDASVVVCSSCYQKQKRLRERAQWN